MIKVFFNIARGTIILSVLILILYTSYQEVQAKPVFLDKINIDSVSSKYITETKIISIISDNTDILDSVLVLKCFNSNQIENILIEDSLIKEAEVYVDNEGGFSVDIKTRQPFVRIMTDSLNYYLDYEGAVLSYDLDFRPRVLVFNGDIDEEQHSVVYNLAKFINSDSFWLSQITQVYFKNEKVILIPRVGEHKIHLGMFIDIEMKLDNLYQFYKEAKTVEAWGAYSDINLEYKNQIICTKK